MTDDEILKRAAEIARARRDPDRLREAARENIAGINEQRKTQGFSEETRAKLRNGQAVRRERERLERKAKDAASPQADTDNSV